MTYKRAGVVWFLIMCYIKLSSPAYTKKNSTESIDDLVTTLFKEDGSLLLNLKWRARLNPGTNLDVIINPRGEGCSNKPCSEYGLPGNTTEITFPKDVGQFIEYGQCTFEPGCSYFVKVTTEKRHIQRNLTMTLPGDCYLGICSCRHFKDLPIPDVSAGILDSNSLNISWTIPPLKSKLLERNVTLNSVFISISQGNTQLLTWGGKQSSIYSHFYPLNLTTFNHSTTSKHHFNLSTKLVPGSYYIIRAHIVDVRGCRSRESIFTLPVRVTKNESRQSTESTSSQIFTLIIPMVIALLIVVCVGNYVYKHTCKVKPSTNWRSIYRNTPPNGINQISMEENLLYMDKDILDAQEKGKADIFEVPHSCLVIGEEIGKGAFGRVFKATAHNLLRLPGTTTVAVKQLKKRPTTDEVEEFLGEIQTMKDVGRHENVVALLGCCTIKEPLMMIMEYVGHGDLLQYLRNVRKKHLDTFRIQTNGLIPMGEIPVANSQPPRGRYLELKHSASTISSDASYIKQPETPSTLRPSVTETMYTMLTQNSSDSSQTTLETLDYVLDNKELHNFALQIARGMRHLEEKGITHRDLAARNILIDARKTLKISDFGLSRAGIYVNTKTKKLPLRWLSIEAIRDNLYSSSSDVWAFAVVLWEIGTLGGFPYPTVNNHEILEYLSQGKRLDRPEICSEILYQLMLKCWHENPESRPTFAEIVKQLQPQNQKIYVDFNSLGPDYVFPPTREQVLESRINEQDNIKH